MTMFPETELRFTNTGALGTTAVAGAIGAGMRRVATAAIVLASLLTGFGWLYAMRGIGWFGGGTGVHDALPLLQLAGYDIQPLDRVVVAWLLAGIAAGIALRRVP